MLMIVQEDFLKKIKDFGLNSYEAKIWTALLSRGIATAGELSDISNVPRSRSYDVLESLEKKGFIIMKIGKPIKYIAVSPKEVIERVKKKVSEEADKSLALMEELKDSNLLEELTQLHTNGIDAVAPEDITGAVKGRDSVYEHFQLMIKGAENEIILVTSEEGLVRKKDALLKSLKKASNRGVDIKIAAPITNANKALAEEFKEVGVVKALDAFTARFMIVDNDQLSFMLTDDGKVHPSYDIGVWVNTSIFAQALASIFAIAWKDMKEI